MGEQVHMQSNPLLYIFMSLHSLKYFSLPILRTDMLQSLSNQGIKMLQALAFLD